MQVMIYISDQDTLDSIRLGAEEVGLSVSAYLVDCHTLRYRGKISTVGAGTVSKKPEKKIPNIPEKTIASDLGYSKEKQVGKKK